MCMLTKPNKSSTAWGTETQGVKVLLHILKLCG